MKWSQYQWNNNVTHGAMSLVKNCLSVEVVRKVNKANHLLTERKQFSRLLYWKCTMVANCSNKRVCAVQYQWQKTLSWRPLGEKVHSLFLGSGSKIAYNLFKCLRNIYIYIFFIQERTTPGQQISMFLPKITSNIFYGLEGLKPWRNNKKYIFK